MGEILGLGMSHYPGIVAQDENMSAAGQQLDRLVRGYWLPGRLRSAAPDRSAPHNDANQGLAESELLSELVLVGKRSRPSSRWYPHRMARVGVSHARQSQREPESIRTRLHWALRLRHDDFGGGALGVEQQMAVVERCEVLVVGDADDGRLGQRPQQRLVELLLTGAVDGGRRLV